MQVEITLQLTIDDTLREGSVADSVEDIKESIAMWAEEICDTEDPFCLGGTLLRVDEVTHDVTLLET